MGVPKRQERLRGRHAYVDGIRFVMPVDSRNSSAMMAAFPINWEKARALIPPGDVHPFRLWDRGLLVVTVIDYRDTDIGAYIEYSLAIACTKGAAPAPREAQTVCLLSALLPEPCVEIAPWARPWVTCWKFSLTSPSEADIRVTPWPGPPASLCGCNDVCELIPAAA